MEPLFERKITSKMKHWKDCLSKDYALLIEGARRIGKTTAVKRFVEENYKTSIFIDFSRPPARIKELIRDGAYDLDRFFLHLQRISKTELHQGNSAIVFDEVQLCPEARQMIKHLVADSRYDYIETGSLISIRQNIQNILVPSEEYRIQMYPMDFEEFLWATGDHATMPLARKCFMEKSPMGRYAHRDAMEAFRLYMLIGGMPQAVAAYVGKNSFDAVETRKREILNLYSEDLGKIKNDSSGKCKRLFANIPGLLSKHDKTFKAGSVKKNSRKSDYLDAVNALEESKIVNICRRCSDPGPAMGLGSDEEGFKMYMADTGLLFTAAFGSNLGRRDEVYDMVLRDKMGINEGMFLENVVAQELKSSGHDLYYDRFRTDDSVNTQEVDFVLADGGKICPVEVKSGQSSRHASLDRFIRKYGRRIDKAYVVHTKDLRLDGGLMYVPAYMASFIVSNAPTEILRRR